MEKKRILIALLTGGILAGAVYGSLAQQLPFTGEVNQQEDTQISEAVEFANEHIFIPVEGAIGWRNGLYGEVIRNLEGGEMALIPSMERLHVSYESQIPEALEAIFGSDEEITVLCPDEQTALALRDMVAQYALENTVE